MNHVAGMEEQIVSERLRRKLEEVNAAAQAHLAPVQDHVNFTLQVSSLFLLFLLLLFFLFAILGIFLVFIKWACSK